MGRETKGNCPERGISHTSTMINMLVQERKAELEKHGVSSGQECLCVCGSDMEKRFMKGQPIGIVRSYHGT